MSLVFTPHRKPSGAPFAAGSANEGLQVNPFNGKIQLGEENGFATGLAQLFSNREIIADLFQLIFTLASNSTERVVIGSRFVQLESDFLSTGHRPTISLNDGVVGGTLTTDGTSAFIIGTSSASVLMDKLTGAIRVIGGAPPPDNGAKLQVDGEITTADPGSGVGKWRLGTRIAGAVALDAAHFVEVKIGGTVVKLGIVV